jgi:predicted small lipoprotein YifL
VNAVFNLSRPIRAGIAIAVISMLAACGQRGPLYLPKGQTSEMISKPAVPATAPVATPDASDSSSTPATPSAQKKDAADNSTQSNQQK